MSAADGGRNGHELPADGRSPGGAHCWVKVVVTAVDFFSHWQFLTKENDEEERERWAERL